MLPHEGLCWNIRLSNNSTSRQTGLQIWSCSASCMTAGALTIKFYSMRNTAIDCTFCPAIIPNGNDYGKGSAHTATHTAAQRADAMCTPFSPLDCVQSTFILMGSRFRPNGKSLEQSDLGNASCMSGQPLVSSSNRWTLIGPLDVSKWSV